MMCDWSFWNHILTLAMSLTHEIDIEISLLENNHMNNKHINHNVELYVLFFLLTHSADV